MCWGKLLEKKVGDVEHHILSNNTISVEEAKNKYKQHVRTIQMSSVKKQVSSSYCWKDVQGR